MVSNYKHNITLLYTGIFLSLGYLGFFETSQYIYIFLTNTTNPPLGILDRLVMTLSVRNLHLVGDTRERKLV